MNSLICSRCRIDNFDRVTIENNVRNEKKLHDEIIKIVEKCDVCDEEKKMNVMSNKTIEKRDEKKNKREITICII